MESVLLMIGAAIAITAYRKYKGISGIGRAERIKRRIYKEVSLAQDAGINFTQKPDELSSDDREVLTELGQHAGWKQSRRSIESGKPYAAAYYNSLRRAWNAVSGIRGIGTVYNVRDAAGNTVLTWIEDAAAHVAAERELEEKRQRTLALDEELRKRRNKRRKAPQVEVPVENYAMEDPFDVRDYEKHYAEPELPFSGVGYTRRHNTYGGNSGYRGYSMSNRAYEARQEGRYPRTDFKKEYGVTDNSFELLVSCGIITSGEWHHTSSWGNRTNFYGWDDDSYEEIYNEHKKEIDRIALEARKRQKVLSELVNAAARSEVASDKYFEENKKFHAWYEQIKDQIYELFNE